jgi:hypothetical protein
MAKQGQHNNDHRDQDVSRGPNEHEHSVDITTGSYKRQETYEQEAREHRNPDPVAQHDANEWHADTHHPPSHKDQVGDSTRDGSDSNAH